MREKNYSRRALSFDQVTGAIRANAVESCGDGSDDGGMIMQVDLSDATRTVRSVGQINGGGNRR